MCFHEGLALVEVEVENVVDVRANSDFVHIVIIINALIVPLDHRKRKLLFLIQLPTIFQLLHL